MTKNEVLNIGYYIIRYNGLRRNKTTDYVIVSTWKRKKIASFLLIDVATRTSIY